jgi:2-isopropylmalate synthase
MEKKLRMTPEQVLEQAKLAVRFARNLCADVEFSPEDGYRSDPDFLCRVLEAVIAEGATTINIPDTVGYAVPELYGSFIRDAARACAQQRQGDLVGALPQRPGHGGGQLAGRREDRRRAPGRVHDQRPGRTRRQLLARGGGDGGATRRDYFGLDVGIDATQIVPASAGQPDHRLRRAAEQGRGGRQRLRACQRHPPGRRAEGARHLRDHARRGRGLGANKIVLGKLSGRNAFKQRLQELGISMESETEINAAFARFKDLADRKSDIFDEDILALVMDERHRRARALPAAVAVAALRDRRASACPRRLRRRAAENARRERRQRPGGREPEGHRVEGQAGAEMLLYSVNAITSGSTESQGEVTVRLQHGRPRRQRRRGRPGHRRGFGQGLPVGAEQAAQQDRARGRAGLMPSPGRPGLTVRG